jgi:hypothetical protein
MARNESVMMKDADDDVVDLWAANHVEILIDQTGKLWVNVNGRCRLRTGHVSQFDINITTKTSEVPDFVNHLSYEPGVPESSDVHASPLLESMPITPKSSDDIMWENEELEPAQSEPQPESNLLQVKIQSQLLQDALKGPESTSPLRRDAEVALSEAARKNILRATGVAQDDERLMQREHDASERGFRPK